ncbi:Hypothetical predicted protein, partial [Podarcis lilfordi]
VHPFQKSVFLNYYKCEDKCTDVKHLILKTRRQVQQMNNNRKLSQRYCNDLCCKDSIRIIL